VLTVAVLGPVEARADGVRLDLPAGKTTQLLARLALDAGSPVRTDVLLEDLWAEPTGRNTLQSKVSQLRRAIGDKDLVVGTGSGYALGVAPEAVDAWRVVRLAAASAAAREAGDPATSLDQAREGLKLYRGEVLLDAGDWAAVHRSRLEELRLGLLEDAMTARVELGAGGGIVAELDTLVQTYPLREAFWAALITVLYRSGRQAHALAAYARLRRLLVDELGIEPGSALQALAQEVLQQDPRLDVVSVRTLPRKAARTAQGERQRPGNVPPVARPLIGRGSDVCEVSSALASHRLVTITGSAGVGKTRLALEVAHRLTPPGGVWLVRLDAIDRGSSVPQVVADTLAVSGGHQALRERLASLATVLLLDNCEHVIEPVAELVQSLLQGGPQVRVLATSQAPLGLDDEWRHQLEPLTPNQSVALFAQRAQELRRHFALDGETTALVEEVCRSLDGLPLAIELAAARVRSMSVRDIARRLDDRFALVRDPNSPRPERRRALAGAIAWSYELLFPDDQRGLWAISCFAGSASLDATEQVMTALGVPVRSVLDIISRLVDRSLVTVDTAEGGNVRYRLLDSIRLYAAEQLHESGQGEVAAAAHANWYATTAAWCDERVRTREQAACLAIARAERSNIDAALAWCATEDPLLGVTIATGFGWTWVVLGDGTAGAARVRNALVDHTPARDRATGLLLAGWLEASAGDVTLAQADLDTARDLAEDLADEVLVADVQLHQAFVAIQQGRPEVVLASAGDSLRTYRAHRLDWPSAASLLLRAFGALMRGDTGAAAGDATEALTVLAEIEDSWGIVHAQAMLGGIAQAEHRFDDAALALGHAADQSAAMGFVGQAALHRATLARVQHRSGDPRAKASYQQAIDDALASGDGRLAATARLNLARLHRATGDWHQGVALLTENQRWYAAAGGGDFALLNDCILAAGLDDGPGLVAALAASRGAGNVEVQVYALDALARLAADTENQARARSLLAQADQLALQVGHLMDPQDRLDAMLARGRLLAP
jgi:predicted ATPase/DNA-binding SARP family transcriptional activator